MRKIILLLLLVLPVGICSCELFSKDETVEFELPQWPDYLPELQSWQVEVLDTGKPAQQIHKFTLSPHARSLSLKVDKNRPCGLLLTPLTSPRFFKPAGTVYPYSQKITWSGGYSANLVKTISQAVLQNGYTSAFVKDYISSFNWEKLLQLLEQMEESPDYNPWLLDNQSILEGIAGHSFSANKVKMTQTISLSLDFKVFSSYVPQNFQLLQASQILVSVKINEPGLFLLPESQNSSEARGLLISAASAKNISLEFISLPIYIEEI